MENLVNVFYLIIGLGTFATAFKAIDWLISLKYVSKDICNICREELIRKQGVEDVKLTRIETKVDMLLEMRKNET